jgi:UDP-N-acetylenolpyruvoylglucosamine reductase
MKCPGSYFKNLTVEELDEDQRKRIPPSFVRHGKIPAGKLLEAVGANGARKGDAAIASYHGNLIVNTGRATARDVVWLAGTYARRVQESFGVRLEPEIRVIREKGGTA